MANDVTFERSDYTAAQYQWNLVEDVVAGAEAVKCKTEAYLPKPNPLDKSKENDERFKQYLRRAVFYNATGRTLQGLIGAAFRKVPEVKFPAQLQYVEDDIDGAGLSIYQQSQATLKEVLKIGRNGLLVDYPANVKPGSKEEMEQNHIRSTVASIGAKRIINWRTERVGAVHKLVLLVISEDAEEVADDGFGTVCVPQYRVLRLNGGYTQEVWRKDAQSEKWVIYTPEFSVLDYRSKPWDEIPFTFVGANNNDPSIDPSPLYDMAEINIAHYRNSADYEDSCYLTGQPQVYMAGLTQEWVDMLEKKGIYFGSRAPFMLPVDGSAGLLQAEPNTLCKEAMDQKEKQMIALGARLIQPGTAVKTATEAQGENETQHSVLSLAVSNVSEAYVKCLEWMGRFMGAEGEVVYAINQEFTKPNLDAQMLTAMAAFWNTGKWPEGDLWNRARYYGMIDSEKTDEMIREELTSQGNPGVDLDEDETAEVV